MLNPTPFFAADYFASRDVTLKRLKKFTVDAIRRLTDDNPNGVFDALIADLQRLHDAMFGSMQQVDQGTTRRRGSAQSMWAALEGLQDQLEDDEALIDYRSKKNPLVRAAFFPNGRSEYGEASLLTADLLFSRAQAAAQTHAAELGPEFSAQRYADLYAQFKAGRDGTGQGDEQTDKARAEAGNHRAALTTRLTDAVKLVAAQFPRDAARCAAYFRFELLTAGTPEAAPVAAAALA